MKENDPQRKKEYDWEACAIEPYFPMEDLPLSICEKIAKTICKRHGISAPLLLAGESNLNAKSVDMHFKKNRRTRIRHVIQLPKGYRNFVTLVHECCHFLKHELDDGASHHGPLFVRLMIDEIAHYGAFKSKALSKKTLEDSAMEDGLLFCERDKFRQRLIYNKKKRGSMPKACTECMRMWG